MSAFIIHGYFFHAGYMNAAREKSETFHPMSHYLRKKGISVEADVINLRG